jgi:hypothetical protein
MRRLPLPHHKHDPSSRRGLVKGAERMDSRQDIPSPSSASKSASDRAPAPRESPCLIVPETSGQPASEPSPRQRNPSLLRSIQFSKRSLRVPSQRVATGTGQIGALDRESNYRASRRHRSYRFRGRHHCPVVDKVWKLSTDSSGRGKGVAPGQPRIPEPWHGE